MRDALKPGNHHAPRLRALVVVFAFVLMAPMAPSHAVHAQSEDGSEQLARSLVREFVAIAMLPADEERAALEDYLAPEFQIVRAAGETLDEAALSRCSLLGRGGQHRRRGPPRGVPMSSS